MLTAALILLIALVLLVASIAAILVALLMYVIRMDSWLCLLCQHVGVDSAKLGKRVRIHPGQGF